MNSITKSPVYRRYTAIRQSVYNPNCPEYPNIGGSGIGCYWDNSIDFHNYIMDTIGPPPHALSRLLRIDTSRDYEPGNLFWGDPQIMGYRFPFSTRITWGTRTQTIAQWAQELNIAKSCIRERLIRGLSDGQALGFEPLPYPKRGRRHARI